MQEAHLCGFRTIQQVVPQAMDFLLEQELMEYIIIYGMTKIQLSYLEQIILHECELMVLAELVLEETLQHHTNNPQILMILLTIHRDRGNQKDAAQYAKRLMALSPQAPGVRQLLQQLQSSEQD